MRVWIKDDRDSVTRWENLQKICELGLDRSLHFCQSFIVHTLVIKHGSLCIFKHDISFHISRIMHTCIICIARHQVRYLMPNLFPKVKKYGRPFGSSDQRHREYSRRMQTWHPRGKGTSSQVDKFVRRPHQNTDGAFPRSIIIAKSTGPSTIRPNYELFATKNWSPQPAVTTTYSSNGL